MELVLVLVAALVLDKLLGEVNQYHPIVGFGRLAAKLEKLLNSRLHSDNYQKIMGTVAWLVLIVPFIGLYSLTSQFLPWWVDVVFLYFALGNRSLKEHAIQVYKPLVANDIDQARHYCGYLVSRETNELNETEVSRAVVESVLENGHDAVIASLFWYCVGGIPLVIAHRLANTLDAMWGYKSSRFANFGWFSAKLDDLLGWPSAKITALLYAIQSSSPLLCLKNAYCQGRQYKSLNGGYVMASGATSLYIKLGGSAKYFGQEVQSVLLGVGNKVTPSDIPASTALVTNASYYFVVVVFALALFI